MTTANFDPYAGKDKYIFISYSHSDKERVFPILDRLHDEGFRIWYDEGIEWGTEWPDDIAEHIDNCDVFMAFHSEASNVSENCQREIHYVLNREQKDKKKFLSIYLEKVELNRGTKLEIGRVNETYPYQYSDIEVFYEKLIKNQKLQDCRQKTQHSCQENMLPRAYKDDINVEEITQSTVNDSNIDDNKSYQEKTTKTSVDKQLDECFRKIFEGPSDSKEVSSLRQRIAAVKGRNFMNSMESRLKKELAKNSEILGLFSLIPEEYKNNNLTEEKHFTLPDISGYKTIAFKICVNYDCKTFTEYYTCEPINSIKHTADDGLTEETTYYVEPPRLNEENDIVILHFNNETNEAFVNMGILSHTSLKISKKPTYIKMQSLCLNEKNHLSKAAYDLSSIKEAIKDYGDTVKDELCMEADIRENVTIIIDTETASPVKRELYYDELSHGYKARIRINRAKNYFAFQLCNEKAHAKGVKLPNNKIANYYKLGLHGFPKDALKAAEYYGKDGSAESLYEIAALFRSEESMFDEDTYLEYLNMAVNAGSPKAIIELALRMFFDPLEDNTTSIMNLLERVEGSEGLKNFIMGYITEKRNVEAAFDYYYKAASNEFRPAFARLGIEELTEMSDSLRTYFKESSEKYSIADYCMGSILFWGLDISPHKDKGVKLLKESASEGCWRAAESLYYIYENDPKYKDPKESLKWLLVCETYDISLTNTLANKLIDGIGCKICDENDKFAFSLLQKATEAGDKVAQSNLGWMYKTGRGCPVDYGKARQLFINAETAGSFFHLGEMYEHGLGVPIDIETAKYYYKKGAEKGSIKAQKRLENCGCILQ